MKAEFHPSVCPHDCPSACALEVEKLDEKTIGRVRGAKGNDYTRGAVCEKVAKYAQRVHHPDRLSTPLKRVSIEKGPEALFEPISWDEALDTVAKAFIDAEQTFGAESVWPYYYGGTMGQIQRDGINALRHHKGYSRLKSTVCTQIAYVGWKAGCGSVRGADARNIQYADVAVVWGGNPVATQVNLMKHINQAKRERGCKLVVIDPTRTETAEKADMHLALKPGTDGALACAVMQQCFEHGWADWAYLRQYTDNPDAFAAHIADKTPAWAAAITGLSAAQITEFAALIGRHQKTFIRCGIGFTRSRNGAVNAHAVSCIPAVTGAWQVEGGGALLGASGIFGLNKSWVESLPEREETHARELDMSRVGAILCGEEADLFGGAPVKAMLIQNSNPMAIAPESVKVKRGFEREDLFVCVHEQFMTDTAKMADIVLPATTFLEHSDLYQSYGQTYLQYSGRVIKPYAESRSNLEVVHALAKRLGVAAERFTQSADQLMEKTLEDSGRGALQTLKQNHWLDCEEGIEKMQFLDGFDWADGKFRFFPDWEAEGQCVDEAGERMPETADHWAVLQEADAAHPFRLMTSPARRFLNSTFNEAPNSVEKEIRPTVKIHPQDAAGQHIGDGERVEIGNQLAKVTLWAQITDEVRPGVLESRGVWRNDAFPDGLGINALTSAKVVAPDGGSAFHDNAVWIRSAPAAR